MNNLAKLRELNKKAAEAKAQQAEAAANGQPTESQRISAACDAVKAIVQPPQPQANDRPKGKFKKKHKEPVPPNPADLAAAHAGQILTYACGHSEGLGNCIKCRLKALDIKKNKYLLRPAKPDKSRLPTKAKFAATYCDETKTWTGSLKIPKMKAFEGTCSGVFRLMEQLDNLYRDSIAPPAPTVEETKLPEEKA